MRFEYIRSKVKDVQWVNRMKVSLFAVFLMWTSSLNVAFFISSMFVTVPNVQDVLRTVQNSLDVVQHERRSFENCVDAQLERCSNELHTSKRAELKRMNETAEENYNVVNNAAQIQTECFMLYSSLYRSLEKFVEVGGGLSYKESCESSDRDRLSIMVGDMSAVRSQAFEIVASYSQESINTVARMAQYAQERALYDMQYIDNHTEYIQNEMELYLASIDIPGLDFSGSFELLNGNVEELVSCISLRDDNMRKCKFSNPARRSLELITGTYDQQVDSLLQQWDSFDEKTKKYKENAVDAYENALEFYQGARDFVNRMKSVVIFFDNSWLGGWYDIPPSSFYTVEVPFPKTRPEFTPLPSLDEIWSDVSFNLDQFQTNLTHISELAALNVEIFRENIKEKLLDTPSLVPRDYDPPDYVGRNNSTRSTEDEYVEYRTETERFLEQSASALDAFSELSRSQKNSSDKGEHSSPLFNFSFDADLSSSYNVDIENLIRPGIDFDTIILELLGIGNFLFFADFVIRIYFSARLIYKYWDSSSITAPTLDLSKDSSAWNPLKTSPWRLLFALVFNRFTASIALGFMGFSVLMLISSIYAPLYNEYISGCVHIDGNGTFLAKNMYSMAYNFASRDGNKALIEGLHDIDSSRGESCSEYRSTSTKNYQDDAISLSSLKYSNAQTLKEMDLFERCLNIDELSNSFEEACCGKPGYGICVLNQSLSELCPWNDLVTPSRPFLTPGVYLGEQSYCDNPLDNEGWNLKDSIFNCSELPVCSITCAGPCKEILQRTTKECTCITEWYIHSAWLQMAIAFTIYIISNLSRVVILSGITRIFWNHLRPERLNFISSCSISGIIIGCGESVVDKRVEPKRIAAIISRFKLTGYIVLLAGVSINIIWIYLLAFVGNTTKPYWLR